MSFFGHSEKEKRHLYEFSTFNDSLITDGIRKTYIFWVGRTKWNLISLSKFSPNIKYYRISLLYFIGPETALRRLTRHKMVLMLKRNL